MEDVGLLGDRRCTFKIEEMFATLFARTGDFGFDVGDTKIGRAFSF